MEQQQIPTTSSSSELTWKEVLASERNADYFKKILEFVASERAKKKEIFPPDAEIFNAFKYTSFSNARVVILGQDPYHGPGQAHGLCFSVRKGVRPPPSLINIFKELQEDLGINPPPHGSLEAWAHHGVLLLNSSLTVERGKPSSHQSIGWERFTDAVVSILNERRSNLVFLLWGAHAQRKAARVDRSRHLVLTAAHPSPFSAHSGFFGCRHFSKANEYLQKSGQTPVDWNLNQ